MFAVQEVAAGWAAERAEQSGGQLAYNNSSYSIRDSFTLSQEVIHAVTAIN